MKWSFNAKMVRVKYFASTSFLLMSFRFNAKMVRVKCEYLRCLIAFLSLVSMPKWCELSRVLPPIFAFYNKFQCQNGAS